MKRNATSRVVIVFISVFALLVLLFLVTSPRGRPAVSASLRYAQETLSAQTHALTHPSSSGSSGVHNEEHIDEPTMFVQWPDVQPAPSAAYPQYDSLLSIIQRWNPDDPDPPQKFTEMLQHFNYSDPAERAMAERYLEAEVPFKLYDIPEFDAVTYKWTDDYIAENIAKATVERSETNHFMFWGGRKGRVEDFTPPTKIVHMDFRTWRAMAKEADEKKLPASAPHHYFMSGAPKQDTFTFIGRDLTLFSTKESNFFIREVDLNKGIQCRFGMRGVIAEAHYDSGRNMVALLRGRRRYILTPPETCKHLGIISDRVHPSFRHSILDWSSEAMAKASGFANVKAIDTVMRPGEVLYIPSYWFHYVISLQYSIQCNSRHGTPPNDIGKKHIDECVNFELPSRLKEGGIKKKKKKVH